VPFKILCNFFSFEKLDDGEGAKIISPYYTITIILPNWVELAQKCAILQNVNVKLKETEFRFFIRNLVFTIPECLKNSTKWSLPVKHTFYFVLNELFGQHVSTRYWLTCFVHFHSRGIRLTNAEMQEWGTQANASHWTSPNISRGGPCCFPSLPVCVYKFSSHYFNNIIFIDNSFGPLARESPCTLRLATLYLYFYYTGIP
jgi:hypothetical protein